MVLSGGCLSGGCLGGSGYYDVHTWESRSEAGKPFVSNSVLNLDAFWRKSRKSRKIKIWTSLDHLERELEALLWVCFSLGYILLIFEEKKFTTFFFAEIFFIEKNFPTFFDDISNISDPSSKIENLGFSSKKVETFFFDEKIFGEKKVGKIFFLQKSTVYTIPFKYRHV